MFHTLWHLKTTTVPFALIHIKESQGTPDLLFATFAVILFAVIASVTLTLNVAQQDGAWHHLKVPWESPHYLTNSLNFSPLGRRYLGTRSEESKHSK